MSADLQAQQIHDRATRGEPISAEERSQLDQWYARMDAEEGALLNRGQPQELAALRGRIDAAVAQVRVVTQRIQTLTTENETARREVAALQRQLAQKSTPQPA
jgi:predicted RNase H-like nuclease (RuvC/YqgF family)